MSKKLPIEPPHGSVVLAHGREGTAFQRFYADGFWHSTTGRTLTWEALNDESRTPIVIHDPSQVGTPGTAQSGVGGGRA